MKAGRGNGTLFTNGSCSSMLLQSSDTEFTFCSLNYVGILFASVQQHCLNAIPYSGRHYDGHCKSMYGLARAEWWPMCSRRRCVGYYVSDY